MKDPYVYPDTFVLINRFNIRSQEELDEVESRIVPLNLSNLTLNPFPIKSVFDIKKVHKALFGDLYDWAGEYRTINMYKEEPVLNGLSVEYSNYRNLETDLKKLDQEFGKISWEKQSKTATIDLLVRFISGLWKVHCFREGNTRTVTTFLYLLMKQHHFRVNADFIGKHAKYFRNALVLASIGEYSEYEYLTEILLDSISGKVSNTNKYQTIRDYQVEKYEYQKHKYKD